MSSFLALVIIGTFVAGAIALPGKVNSWQSEGPTVRELEQRLNNLEADTLPVLYRRIANLESRQDESRKEVDDVIQQTDLRLAKIHEDNMDLLNMIARRHEEEIKVSMIQNANLMQAVNESLNADNPKLCRSGSFGTNYYPGIEETWPQTYNLVFNPSFQYPPQLTYGIDYLDTSYVRVYTKVLELTMSRAKVEVGTWYEENLHGVTYKWMACP